MVDWVGIKESKFIKILIICILVALILLCVILIARKSKVSTESNRTNVPKGAKFEGILVQTLYSPQVTSIISFTSLSNTLFASSSREGAISIWDLSSGQVVRNLMGHSDWVKCMKILPNGNLASGSDDETIKIWNPNNGQLVRTISRHTDWVRGLEVLNDGRLISGSNDRTLKVWDVSLPNDPLVQTFAMDGAIWGMALMDTGNLAVRLSADQVKIVNVKTGAILRSILEFSLANSIVALGGDVLAVVKSYTREIKVYSARNGSVLCTLNGHRSTVEVMVRLPDGSLASGSNDGDINVWNVENGGQLLNTLKASMSITSQSLRALQVMNGSRLLSGNLNGEIKIWK